VRTGLRRASPGTNPLATGRQPTKGEQMYIGLGTLAIIIILILILT
jgi:hypothetical protein